MNTMVEAIREQTRMIAEQNTLLRQMAGPLETPQREFSAAGRMMNEHDLQLILFSDNITEAIDRWNAGRRPHGRKV